MKKHTFLILLFISQIFSQAFSQGFSSATKLQYYAGACNAAQVEVLLKNDNTFDIYDTQVTYSPVMVAIERFINANNAQNLKSCADCRLTIETILRDSRYKWKRSTSLNETDLMFILSKGKSVTNNALQISGYQNLVGIFMKELQLKPDFDINYTLPPNMPNLPSNAIGAVAAKGLKSTFCYLLDTYPSLRYNLDKRPNEQHYPAIMLASAYNNLEMVKALGSNGSDYYLKVTGFGNFPSEEIATQQGFSEISAYLNRRRLGNEPVTKNGACFE
jgi:ankyrin repeat protein